MERAVLTINKSFYYSAGKKYGWCPPKWDTYGVGINVEILQNYRELEIIVDNVHYLVNCGQAIAFIRRFKSIEDHKGISVGIVSKTLLNEIVDTNKKVEEKDKNSFPQPEILQKSLFGGII